MANHWSSIGAELNLGGWLSQPLSYIKGLVDTLIDGPSPYVLDNFDNNHNEGENLFIFTYDWRMNNSFIAESLNVFIDSVKSWTGANQVNLIAR